MLACRVKPLRVSVCLQLQFSGGRVWINIRGRQAGGLLSCRAPEIDGWIGDTFLSALCRCQCNSISALAAAGTRLDNDRAG